MCITLGYISLTLAQPSPKSRNEIAPIVANLAASAESGKDNKARKSISNKPFEVCIIGAGAAGLFTAMIFDYLNERFKINVKYEILECNSEDRLGGRLFTHYFRKEDVPAPHGDHDYYDVGAMRFPGVITMGR